MEPAPEVVALVERLRAPAAANTGSGPGGPLPVPPLAASTTSRSTVAAIPGTDLAIPSIPTAASPSASLAANRRFRRAAPRGAITLLVVAAVIGAILLWPDRDGPPSPLEASPRPGLTPLDAPGVNPDAPPHAGETRTGAQVARPGGHIAARELYLRGSDPTLLRSDSAARRGLEYLAEAIALDPTYGAAWAGLARLYARVAADAPVPERERYWALADEAARKALALDDSLADAHATLGVIRMRLLDAPAAERHLKHALALDPTHALTHEWLVTIDLWNGRPTEALARARRGVELDPLSPIARAVLARALLHNHRCEEALAQLETLADLQPPLLRAAPLAALCYARMQRWPEAIATLRPQAERGEPHAMALLGHVYAHAGQRQEAVRIRDSLIETWRRGEGNPFQVAVVYAGLGDLDQAIAWLDKALAEHAGSGVPGRTLSLLILGPLLDDLGHDPRFEDPRRRLALHLP